MDTSTHLSIVLSQPKDDNPWANARGEPEKPGFRLSVALMGRW